MACPVQDQSHISWRWWKHRETHKLHNSLNCWTNSRAHPSGSTSDYSQHGWGGGNWLWDMPTGSDGRIGHVLCHSQICAQDPDSWPEAAARQRLHWTSSANLWWWNLLVQGHHWWWELGLWLRPCDKATILPVEKPHVTKAKKGQTGEKQCQEHDQHFLWCQGDCAQRICPNRPNCEFRVLLLSFAETVWKSAKTSSPTLARTDLAVSPRQRPVSHFRPHPAVSGEKQNGCHSPPTPWFLPISKNETEAEQMPVWYQWIDTGQIAECAWHSDKKGLPGSVPKMEERVGPVSICRKELLRGWQQPIGLMVSFTIFTASVRKILDTTL